MQGISISTTIEFFVISFWTLLIHGLSELVMLFTCELILPGTFKAGSEDDEVSTNLQFSLTGVTVTSLNYGITCFSLYYIPEWKFRDHLLHRPRPYT
jgi:hypothetical protein